MVSIARIEQPCFPIFSCECGLDGLPLHESNDHRIMLLPSSLVFLSRNDTQGWFNCARRARPFRGRALREQRTNMGLVPYLFASGGGQFSSAWRPQ